MAVGCMESLEAIKFKFDRLWELDIDMLAVEFIREDGDIDLKEEDDSDLNEDRDVDLDEEDNTDDLNDELEPT